MKHTGFPVTCLATLLIGLNAGFFYTWSFTIMQSLDLIDAENAISAMQSINANIRNAWFAVIFFGVVAVQLLSFVLVILTGKHHQRFLSDWLWRRFWVASASPC